jgi:hypothetical protein
MDLTLDTRDYRITHWSEEQVEAEETAGPCVTYKLVVDFGQARTTLARQPTGAEQCSAAIAPPRTYVLASGYDVAARYWDDWRARTHKLRSAAFQKLVERIQGARNQKRP